MLEGYLDVSEDVIGFRFRRQNGPGFEFEEDAIVAQICHGYARVFFW